MRAIKIHIQLFFGVSILSSCGIVSAHTFLAPPSSADTILSGSISNDADGEIRALLGTARSPEDFYVRVWPQIEPIFLKDPYPLMRRFPDIVYFLAAARDREWHPDTIKNFVCDLPRTLRWLIVEDGSDGPCLLQGLRILFPSVSLAVSAQEALELIRHDPAGFDIVVLDYSLSPSMNGCQLFDALKSTNLSSGMLFIGNSGSLRQPFEQRGIPVKGRAGKFYPRELLGLVMAVRKGSALAIPVLDSREISASP